MEKSEENRHKFILSNVRGLVLDVGCVGGDYQLAEEANLSSLTLKMACPEHRSSLFAIGLDLNRAGLIRLKKIEQSLNLICADSEHLPFRPEVFDVIIAAEIIEHLSNVGIFLAEVKEKLKAGGQLIGDVPNAYWYSYIIKALRSSLPPSSGTTHIHLFDEWNLKLLFLQHGFLPEIFYINQVVTSKKLKLFSLIMKNVFPKNSFFLSFRAKKESKIDAELLYKVMIPK